MKKNKKKAIKNVEKKPINIKNYKKKLFKYKLKIFGFYFMLFVILISMGIAVSLTVMFKIDDIQINGQTRYETPKIESMFEEAKGENLFLFDTQKIASNIKKDMPYIEEVKIQKRIPNKIEVFLKEAQPAAIVESENKYIVINKDAKILETREDLLDKVAVIRGINVSNDEESGYLIFNNESEKKVFLDIATALNQNEINNVNEINISDLSNTFIVYDNRIKIVLGNIDNIDCKLKNANFILSNKISPTEKGTLNLSTIPKDGKSYFMPEYS